MEIIFCIMFFIMGTVFGSFFTLAVYRIPLGLDITHERSFCPKCDHKLNFRDLIPIFSYLSLHGKCRYCGNHVRIRYLCLEVLSGLVFLFAYLSFNMNFPYFAMPKIIELTAFVMFYITNAIILGIDKENINVDKRVLLFGILTQFVYIIYLYITTGYSIYRYVMYLAIMLILFIIDTVILKKKGKTIYALQVLMLLTYIAMYIDSWIILIVAILFSIIYFIYKKIKFIATDKPDITKSQINTKVPFAFCLSVSSIIVVIINNFIVL